LPCFDNFVVSDKEISEFKLQPLIKLPEIVGKNPRELIRELGLASDHVPVIGYFVKGDKTLRIGTFNVADPVFWSKYYPAAGAGFDLGKEVERWERIEVLVEELKKRCDVVVLQEAPAGLARRLGGEARKMAKTERDERGFWRVSQKQPEGISNLVLIEH